MFRHQSNFRSLVFVATCFSFLVLGRQVSGQVADGKLDDEVKQVLDMDGDGVRDVLETRLGVAKFQLDESAEGFPPRPDGFRDAALAPDTVPACAICFDTATGRARGPLNTGKLTIIYLPDSDGVIDPSDVPGTDDSLLYVGMDIATGDARTVGNVGGERDLDYHHIDFELDPDAIPPETPCTVGFPDRDGDEAVDYFMVPFDADGDGDALCVTRFSGFEGLVTAPECLGAANPACLVNFGADTEGADRTPETYQVSVFACRTERGGDRLFVIRLAMNAGVQGEHLVRLEKDVDFAHPATDLSLAEISAFPLEGTDSDSLTNRGREAFLNNPLFFGTLDVEFVIKRIDSVVDSAFPDTPYAVDRLRIARGGVSTLSGAIGDLSEEDVIDSAFDLDLPQIEVKKEVRCEGEDQWQTSADALPGSTVEFRIEVENTGNVPLAVQLEDLLEGVTPLDDSLEVILHRAGDPPQVVTFGNAPGFQPPLNRQFIGDPLDPADQGFLDGVDGTRSCLGVLNGVDVCTDPGNPIPGDRVVITFKATVDEDPLPFCENRKEIDVRNSVTAIGDPDVQTDNDGVITGPCPLPPGDPNQIDGNDAVDTHSLVDTARERAQGFDDNVVTANILCRGLELLKEVRLLPAGLFVTGDEQLDIPNDFPADIEYRYTIDNTGEIDEDITLTDQFLCDDVAKTADVEILCQICPSGQLIDMISAGETREYTCQVRFLTREALRNFLQQDDKTGHEDCRVPDTEKDPDNCYRNCASASGDSANPIEICPDGTIDAGDSFTDICNGGVCTVNVTKQVRCLPDCNKNAQGAEVGWVEDPALLEVAPGACLQYRIIVENMDKDGSPGQTAICALEFNDLMTDRGNFTGGPTNVQSGGDATCANANFASDFNWNGTDVVCELDQPLGPGESITVLFEARLGSNANSALDSVNTVEVRGAMSCPAGGVPNFSDDACAAEGACCNDDSVGIDVKECGFEVTKKVRCVDDPPLAWVDRLDDVLPGAEAEFQVKMCNTGEVDIPRVRIEDTLTCSSWFVPGSVTAELDGVDVTSCVCPGGNCTQISDLNGLKDLTLCHPDGITLPGTATDCLTITFKVRIPAGFSTIGADPDCTNTVRMEGFTDLCQSSSENPCGVDEDSAEINVLVPDIDCDKQICADLDSDGDCNDPGDIGFSHNLMLFCEVEYPFNLIYRMEVTNSGEVQLESVRVCDLELVSDAVNAGLTLGACDLDPVTGCADLGSISSGASRTIFCQITVPGADEWALFAGRDDDRNPDCYQNTASATGVASTADDVCAPDEDIEVATSCGATACVPPPCPLGCRMTGGGVDKRTKWDGSLADGKSPRGNRTDHYTFGGQAGASLASQPQPWGEWTHHQKNGPSGHFVFHAGTASAPEDTEIDLIVCSDPGWCRQARPAPNKQLDFEGVGSFKNMRNPSPELENVIPGETLHWFHVHIEDLGEPGRAGTQDAPAPQCPPDGSAGMLADCECPDFYHITIYTNTDPTSDVIYEVFGYIIGGNLQIHPPTGRDIGGGRLR